MTRLWRPPKATSQRTEAGLYDPGRRRGAPWRAPWTIGGGVFRSSSTRWPVCRAGCTLPGSSRAQVSPRYGGKVRENSCLRLGPIMQRQKPQQKVIDDAGLIASRAGDGVAALPTPIARGASLHVGGDHLATTHGTFRKPPSSPRTCS